MTNIELVQYLADGYTVKQVAELTKFSEGYLHKKVFILRERTLTKTVAHLVAVYLRKELIT